MLLRKADKRPIAYDDSECKIHNRAKTSLELIWYFPAIDAMACGDNDATKNFTLSRVPACQVSVQQYKSLYRMSCLVVSNHFRDFLVVLELN